MLISDPHLTFSWNIGCIFSILSSLHNTAISCCMMQATWSGWKGGYGKTVCLDHGNGFITLYAHCYDLLVQTGQFVRKSQVIALSGNTGHSTGPHLHFEIHKDGKTVDPLVHLPPIYHNWWCLGVYFTTYVQILNHLCQQHWVAHAFRGSGWPVWSYWVMIIFENQSGSWAVIFQTFQFFTHQQSDQTFLI